MTSKLAQNSDSSNHNNIINYGEYLCEEKDFQLRRPYLSEMQLIEKLYTPVSLQKMIIPYVIGLVFCFVAFFKVKDANLYLLSDGAIKAIRWILLIFPLVMTVLTADLYLNQRKPEDALVTEVEIIKISYYEKIGASVPVSPDISAYVDIWSKEQKKFAVHVTSGEYHFQVGDRGLLVKHPKRKGIQRFTVWEKDTYSVIRKC